MPRSKKKAGYTKKNRWSNAKRDSLAEKLNPTTAETPKVAVLAKVDSNTGLWPAQFTHALYTTPGFKEATETPCVVHVKSEEQYAEVQDLCTLFNKSNILLVKTYDIDGTTPTNVYMSAKGGAVTGKAVLEHWR